MSLPSPKFIYCSSSPPVWLHLEMGPERRWWMLNEVLKMGPESDRTGTFKRRKTSKLSLSTVWKYSKEAAVYNPEREFSPATNHARPWPGTSRLQNCEKIHFCCGSHMVCGILSLQPKQTNRVIKTLQQQPLWLGRRKSNHFLRWPVKCVQEQYFTLTGLSPVLSDLFLGKHKW